ncbi:hypothetical protein [Campylobacter sp. P091]|uniref:hypothetical protein n=1 Tax=Campylobacter sp. P091 TaxID=1895621 RepID=UPI00112FC4BC|nr:hypothetical protein [Campylobacter sp. P091]
MRSVFFLVFGLSPHQATLKSSTIYNFARWFYYKEMNLDYIKDEVRKICRQHFDLENFYSHINKKDNVFFGWNKLRYFLFEYEESLIQKSQGEKIEWKISLRHIKKNMRQ